MTHRFTDADLAEVLRKQGLPVEFEYRANRKKYDGPSESQIQQAVIRWWAVTCKQHGIPEHLLLAIPLQAARSPQNGDRMKREGARKGTPDMLLAVARYGYHGLWIEMKTSVGRVSPEQEAMMIDLKARDYGCVVCRSYEEAIDAIGNYLDKK